MKTKENPFFIFVFTIVKRWNENGFKYHNGHINILKYAYAVFLAWKAEPQKQNFQLILF